MNFISKIKVWIIAHKVVSVIIALVAVYAGYKVYVNLTSTAVEPRYILANVERGNISVKVSGTGQVSASNQIDLKPKVSGDIVYVGVVGGQEVKSGALIAQIDSRDAQKSVRDAEVSLESAKLSLQKLIQKDPLTLIQKQNSLTQANQSLVSAYDDGWINISEALPDMDPIIDGIDDLYGGYLGSSNITTLSNSEREYVNNSQDIFYVAQKTLNHLKDEYSKTSRTSSDEDIENLISVFYDGIKVIAGAVKSTQNAVEYVATRLDEEDSSEVNSIRADLTSWISITNQRITDLLNSENAIKNAKNNIAAAALSLQDTETGADPLDILSSELSVKQKENTLLDAQEKLADYFIRAPFAGIISSVPVQKGDLASSGTVLATLITNKKLAVVSLNEVDVAKVKIGQASTLTFDAVEGLSIAGKVAEIDLIGTVSQGVVTYDIKLSFDTEDDQVRPGMSVTADIITEAKTDVIRVPNSAVKSNGHQYVEMFEPPLTVESNGMQGVLSSALPIKKTIEVGLADDKFSEVISGLEVGDVVVTRTIATTVEAATTTPSIFGGGNRSGTGGGTGGGGIRTGASVGGAVRLPAGR